MFPYDTPTAFKDHCALYLVAAHGVTDSTHYMIVPSNKYIFFLGISGLELYPPDFFKFILNPMAYDLPSNGLTPAQKIEQHFETYYQTLFDNFVSGTKHNLKPSVKTKLYGPGDILQQHICHFFESSPSLTTFPKGVFQLPQPQHAGIFGNSYSLLFFTKSPAFSEDERVTLENKAVILDPEAYQTKCKDDSTKLISQSDFKLETWFQYPMIIQEAIDAKFRDIFGNKYSFYNTSEHTPQLLSDIVSKTNDKTKQFYFIFSCRGPVSVPIIFNQGILSTLKANRPENMPPDTHPLRKLARSHSFYRKVNASDSAACALDTEPIFSFRRIKEILGNFLVHNTPSMLQTLKLSESPPLEAPEKAFLNLGKKLSGKATFSVLEFARFLDACLVEYSSESVPPESRSPRQKDFVILVNLCRSTFRPFLKGLRSQHAAANKTIGEVLLNTTEGNSTSIWNEGLSENQIKERRAKIRAKESSGGKRTRRARRRTTYRKK
jgi:hypothetical protein